jgi:hypothetical protein
MIPIQPDEVFLLATIHAIAAAFLAALVWFLLPGKSRPTAWFALALIWGWSLWAMVDFASGNTGFFSWFLDPSAEKNLVAMVNSSLLLMVAVAAFFLFWQSLRLSPGWHRVYWLLLTILFGFLAADEYFALHESIVFWRGGYLILGGLTGLLSLAVIAASTGDYRKTVLLFLIGLGVMGVSGVVLDAFSAQNVLDIGPIQLGFIRCRDEFLGVQCRDYNNTEELLELFGASLMVISLWTYLALQNPAKTRGRWLLAAGGLWLVLIISWLWVLPSIEAIAAQDAPADYGELSLVAYSLGSDSIQAGDTLDVTVYMRANRFLTKDYSLSLHLYTQGEAQSIAQDDMSLGEFVYPTRGWLPFVSVRNHFQLLIPDDLVTDASYQLVAILWQGDTSNEIIVQSTNLRTLSDGRITVLAGIAAPNQETNPAPISPVYNFETGISLAGYELPETVEAGDSVSLKFWWRSEQAQDLEMTQFLHWFHEETGDYVIFDQTPFNGRFPVQDWPAGLFAQDSWAITLAEGMPDGIYRLQTGLFRLDNQERLSVRNAQGEAVTDNSIMLGQVVVTNDK